MAGNTAVPGTTVASRVVALLGAFDEQHRRLTLTELAQRAGVAVPTAHRLAAELVEARALARRADGRYVVGRRLWDIGLLAPVEAGLRQVAEPFLHDIHATTRATVHLAVRDGDRALYLERMRGLASVPVVSSVGSTLPLHSTGVGKVLLAHAPADLQRYVLGRLERITPYTVTQPGRLAELLSRVVREGYATTTEEMTLGACSLAVPVRRDDEVVAAIGVVVRSLRRDKARLLAALQVAAQGIGRQL